MDAEHAVLPVNLELVQAVVYAEDDITLIGSGQFELGHPLEKLAVEKDVASTAIEFAWTSTVGCWEASSVWAWANQGGGCEERVPLGR